MHTLVSISDQAIVFHGGTPFTTHNIQRYTQTHTHTSFNNINKLVCRTEAHQEKPFDPGGATWTSILVSLSVRVTEEFVMERDEIHHKMSKKVAQLTKVIFHLNTKNEEAEAHTAAVTEAYEEEVELILVDANTKLQSLLEKRSDSSQVHDLVRRLDDEKSCALRDIQRFRASVGVKEQQTTHMWSDRLTTMQAEVAAITDKCARQASRFKAALQEAETSREEMKSLSEKKLERMRCEHEQQSACQFAQSEACAVACASAEAKLRQCEHRLEEETQRCSLAQQRCQELDGNVTQLRQSLDDYREGGRLELDRLSSERDDIALELVRVREELQRSKDTLSSREEALQQNALESASFQKSVRSLEDARVALLSEMTGLNVQVRELEARLGCSSVEREQVQRDLDTLRELHAQRESELCDAKKHLDVSARHERSLEEEISRMDAACSELRRTGSYSHAHTLKLEQDAKQLEEELERVRGELADVRVQGEKAIQEHEMRTKQIVCVADKHKNEILRLSRLLETDRIQAQRLADEALAAQNQRIDSLRARHCDEIEAWRRQCADVTELKERETVEVVSLRRHVDKLEEDLEALRQRHAQQSEHHNLSAEEHVLIAAVTGRLRFCIFCDFSQCLSCEMCLVVSMSLCRRLPQASLHLGSFFLCMLLHVVPFFCNC